MASSPGPAFARVFYTVSGLVHTMTIPLHSYTVPSTGHDYGQTTRWDGVTEDADGTVEAWLSALADLYTSAANFGSIFWYTQAAPADEPLLVASKNISIAGTMSLGSGEEYLAVAVTFNFLTTNGSKAKIQLMEANGRNAFNKITSYGDLTADEKTVVDQFMDTDSITASRDGSRPNIFRSRTCTHNNKLRKMRRYT